MELQRHARCSASRPTRSPGSAWCAPSSSPRSWPSSPSSRTCASAPPARPARSSRRRRSPFLWRRQENDNTATRRRAAGALQARRQARGLRRLAVRRSAQAARDGARAHGRPRADHARRAHGRREPGAQAVAARPREVAARRGPTVLFVEHDMDMVRDISDWVIVMAQGRIVAEGTPDSVMANPAVIDAYLGAHHDTDLREMDGEASRPRPSAEREPRPTSTSEGPPMSEPKTADPPSARPTSTPPATPSCAPTTSSAATCPASTSSTGPTSTATRASSSASSAPTVPASRRCSRPCSAWSRSAPVGHPRGPGHHQQARRPAGHRRHRVRPADQQRLPEPDHRGEPRDGLLPGSQEVQGALRLRHRHLPGWGSGASSGPARCRAASARWSRWGGR